jgi:hypothetical protein
MSRIESDQSAQDHAVPAPAQGVEHGGAAQAPATMLGQVAGRLGSAVLQRKLKNRAARNAEGGAVATPPSDSAPEIPRVTSSATARTGATYGPSGAAKLKETVSRMTPAGPNATAIHDGWGVCDTETVVPTLKLKDDAGNYKVDTIDFHGNYSKIISLVGGVKEIGGPGVDTSATNYKKQMGDLKYIADDYKGTDPGGASEWYMLAAVDAHESIHESRLLPALTAVENVLAAKFASLSVASKDKTPDKALTEIKALPAYANAVSQLRDIWDAKYVQLITGDHTALTPAAEHGVVDPMITKIDTWAKTTGPEKPTGTAPTSQAPPTTGSTAPQTNAPSNTPSSNNSTPPTSPQGKPRRGGGGGPKSKGVDGGGDEAPDGVADTTDPRS